MINKEILKEIGLTESEAEVYLVLLEFGEVTNYEIANHCKISRPNIYDILKRLKEKGLVSAIIKKRKRFFKPACPERLLEMIKEKEKDFLEILPELNKIYEEKKSKPVVEIFEGIEGLKTISQDMVKEKATIWIYQGAEKKYLENKIPEFFMKRILQEKKKKHIQTRILHSENVTPVHGCGYKYKKLQGKSLSVVSYWAYRDRAVIGIWSEFPLIIRIIDKNVAKAYKQSIKLIWNSIN